MIVDAGIGELSACLRVVDDWVADRVSLGLEAASKGE